MYFMPFQLVKMISGRKAGWTFSATGLDSPTAAAYGATENSGYGIREVL